MKFKVTTTGFSSPLVIEADRYEITQGGALVFYDLVGKDRPLQGHRLVKAFSPSRWLEVRLAEEGEG